jgi:protein-tyrosine phosphatase
MAGDVIHEMQRIAKKEFNPKKVFLLMDALHPGKEMDVPDPWYGSEPDYHVVYSIIEQACEAIILNK